MAGLPPPLKRLKKPGGNFPIQQSLATKLGKFLAIEGGGIVLELHRHHPGTVGFKHLFGLALMEQGFDGKGTHGLIGRRNCCSNCCSSCIVDAGAAGLVKSRPSRSRRASNSTASWWRWAAKSCNWEALASPGS